MATTLTISPGANTTLTISGTSTEYDISGDNTTLTMNTAVSGVNATDIVYAQQAECQQPMSSLH